MRFWSVLLTVLGLIAATSQILVSAAAALDFKAQPAERAGKTAALRALPFGALSAD
jgi:hypothetical protein